jgi:hypothetical protein
MINQECLLRMLAPNPVSGASSGKAISNAQAELSQAVQEVHFVSSSGLDMNSRTCVVVSSRSLI